jgi:FkbM family methyltransferase
MSTQKNYQPTKIYTPSDGKLPYELVQNEAETFFITRSKPELIVIVGGCMAPEVDRMLEYYPECTFIIFEPSKMYFNDLGNKFYDQMTIHGKRIVIENYAVGKEYGIREFTDLRYGGSGSLYKPQNKSDILETYKVTCVHLDGYFEKWYRGDYSSIDMLWCDVQGAELEVLQGASKILPRCKTVFLEVAVEPWQYDNQCSLNDLNTLLESNDFNLHGIGLDTDTNNGTGNAFWTRKDVVRVDEVVIPTVSNINKSFNSIKK